MSNEKIYKIDMYAYIKHIKIKHLNIFWPSKFDWLCFSPWTIICVTIVKDSILAFCSPLSW